MVLRKGPTNLIQESGWTPRPFHNYTSVNLVASVRKTKTPVPLGTGVFPRYHPTCPPMTDHSLEAPSCSRQDNGRRARPGLLGGTRNRGQGTGEGRGPCSRFHVPSSRLPFRLAAREGSSRAGRSSAHTSPDSLGARRRGYSSPSQPVCITYASKDGRGMSRPRGSRQGSHKAAVAHGPWRQPRMRSSKPSPSP